MLRVSLPNPEGVTLELDGEIFFKTPDNVLTAIPIELVRPVRDQEESPSRLEQSLPLL